MKSEVKAVAGRLRGVLHAKLKGKEAVIGTSDHWTSRSNQNYAALTAHYIEDFVLCSLTLEVKPRHYEIRSFAGGLRGTVGTMGFEGNEG